MKKVFDFDFTQVEVRMGDGGYTATGSFYQMYFRNLHTGKKSQVRCFQDQPMQDVINDVKRIQTGNIQGTQFYQNWIKVFFDNAQSFQLKDNTGQSYSGHYSHQDHYRKTCFYFDVGSEILPIQGWTVYLNNQPYNL